MLTRIHIKGYKSINNVEVQLSPLTLLFGPNAAGKSNFLDALQLLSKLATSPHTERSLRSALSRQAARILHRRRKRHQGAN